MRTRLVCCMILWHPCYLRGKPFRCWRKREGGEFTYMGIFAERTLGGKPHSKADDAFVAIEDQYLSIICHMLQNHKYNTMNEVHTTRHNKTSSRQTS